MVVPGGGDAPVGEVVTRTVPPVIVRPKSNHAPTLSAIANRTTDEQSSVSLVVHGSDDDGNRLTYSASGLPPNVGISSSGVISGFVPYSAVSAPVDVRQGIRSRTFSVTVRVSDGKASAARAFSWTIRDTHGLMPNYYGK